MGFSKPYNYISTTWSTFPFCVFHCLWLPSWTPRRTPNPSPLILSAPKSDKKAACSFEQAAFLVRPMRFERTAFGVGGVCCHRFPADYCFESTVYDRFSTLYYLFFRSDKSPKTGCGRQKWTPNQHIATRLLRPYSA